MDKLTEVRNRGIAEARNGLSRLREAATARLSDERGSALAAVLVLVVLLTMVGVAMVNSTFTEISVAYNAGDTASAQYAAEAGLSRAIYEISQNAGWTGTTAAIGTGQYVVTVTSSGLIRSITSTGTQGGGRRVLKAAVKTLSQSAVSTVLANTTATVGSPSAGLTVSNDYPSSAASAVHANDQLSAPTAISVNTAGANVIGGLTANGVITGVGCPTWAWTCNAGAGTRAMPEIDVDSAATTSLKYRAQHTNDPVDGKPLYFKGGDTSRCNSGSPWIFTSTQQCWDYYVNSKSGTLGSGITNPVFFVEFTAATESTTYTTGGGGGGSITTNLPIVVRGRCAGGYNGAGSGGGANQCGSGGQNTLTIGRPAGVVSGDLLVAAISVRSANPSTPSGWTLVWCGNSGSSSGGSTCPVSSTVSLAVYWKVAGASEPSTYSGWTTTQKAAGVITAYYNVNTSTPIDVQNGTGYTSSVTSLSTPSITTAVANTMLVASFGAADGTDPAFGTSVASMPAGMTDEWDKNGSVSSGSASGAAHGAMFDAIQDSIGATGQKTVTMSSSAVGVAHLLALKPATATVATSSGGSAPTFRAASSAATTVSCGSPCISLTISAPAGVVNGDVMIANIVASGTTSTIQAPAGWTLIRRTTSDMTLITVSYLEQAVYYRVAAGEPANYAWTSTGTGGSMAGGISAYSGVDTTTPVDVENVEWVAAVPNYANTSLPAPSVVTTVANDLLVASFAATLNGSPPPALTGPAGWNSRYSATYNIEAQSSDLVQATAGLTAAIRAIAPSTRGQGFGHLLALKPAGGTTVTCGGSTYTETLCIRATPAGSYSSSVPTAVTGAIVSFRRVSGTSVSGDIVFQNTASASANYAHTYQGSDPALLAAGKISMISSGASAGRTSTSITGIVYTFAGSDNPDGNSNLQGIGNPGFDLQHGANGITLTLSGLLLSNGSISLQDTGGTGTATIQYNRTVVENLPAAFTTSTAGSFMIPLSWSSGD